MEIRLSCTKKNSTNARGAELGRYLLKINIQRSSIPPRHPQSLKSHLCQLVLRLCPLKHAPTSLTTALLTKHKSDCSHNAKKSIGKTGENGLKAKTN